MGESALEILSNHDMVIKERVTKIGEIEAILKVRTNASEYDLSMPEIMNETKEKTLDYIEEAKVYSELINKYGMTQEELAFRINKNQSTISNKLRLLKLSPAVKKILLDHALSERHARALLKIKEQQLQLKVLKYICKKQLNVRMTEDVIEKVLQRCGKVHRTQINNSSMNKGQKNLKVFVDTIKGAINTIKRSGVNAKAARIDKGKYFEFIIRVQK